MKLTFLSALFLTTLAAEPLQFIPVTPENTTMADGTPLDIKGGVWKWLPEEGNQGILESAGDPAKNAPTLLIHAKNLEPGSDYEVFGFFWSHGFGAAPASRGKQPYHWPARFGTGLATLTTFGGRMSQDIPWIISPESKTGVRSGYTVVLEEKNPIAKDVPEWITAVDDTRLIRARLGISRADKEGTIPVYADDFPQGKFTGLTRIDGIGLRLLPAGEHDGAGGGKPGYLHLAVRAGDTLNMRRELAAGADVNALDEDGVTPLLYPATAGDQDTVRVLLKAGANPNQPGQSIPPLTGAASWGDAEMVKLLLDAGAGVPDKLANRSPLLDETLDPARLHPAIAAIRAGSLGCLKLILGRNPDLDLAKLEPVIDRLKRPDTWRTPDDMVPDAIGLMHDDLAAFLVARGCKVDHLGLLADCVAFGDRMAKTREALLARGVPAVQPIHYNQYSGQYLNVQYVKAWDALSAAVSIGDIGLTNRFLALAGDVDERYLQALYALADTCGNPEILKAVQGRFPARPEVAAASRDDQSAADNEDSARLFLPRVGARAPGEKPTEGTWRLAVVAAPEASGAAALVEVRATNGTQWQVVDRSLIEAALKEDQHSKPWERGEHRLAELGDRLTADVILVATKLAGGGIQLIRFEAVDVISGLVIHREYAEEKSLGGDKTADQLLAGMNAAMARARANTRSLAISLLTFTASEDVPSATSLARQLRSSMEIEVDGTPGLLSVGMNEINMIAQEQNLRGEGSFWAAACTVEGGIASLPDGRISLTLRLRNLSGNVEKSTDAMVEGAPQDIPALAASAWQKLVESAALPVVAARQAKPDPKQAILEAARLAREAEWLVLCRRPREAKPLAERAVMLGADSETIVPIVLACLFESLPYSASPPLRTFGFDYHLPLDHAPSLPYQRALIDRLDSLCELLEKSESLYHQHGRNSFQWKKNPTIFWTVIRTLCYTRSVIPAHLLSPEQADRFDTFCKGLDRFVPEYMEDLAKAFRDRDPNNFSLQFRNGNVSLRMLERNPRLLECVTTSLLSSVEGGDIPFGQTLPRRYKEDPDRIASREKMMSKIPKHSDHLPLGVLRALELQRQLHRSKGDEISLTIRNCQSETLNAGGNSYLSRSYHLMSSSDDSNYGLRGYFRMWEEGLPVRKNLILHSLFHETAARPECLVRGGYLAPDRWGLQSSLYAMESTKSAKLNRNSRRDELIRRAKENLSEALGDEMLTKQTSQRIEAMICIDLMYGLDVFEPVSMEWMKLSGKSQKASITPTLLTDLLRGPDATPGIFDLPTPDSTTPGRLWLRYRPYENGLARTDGEVVISKKTKERGAWLFAIDCKSGQIEIQTALSAFPELKDDGEQRVPMRGSGTSFIAQNSSTLLTHVGWETHNTSGDWRGAYALIDKSTGKSTSLIKGLSIKTFNGYPRHQGACVEVFRDEFHILAHRGARYDSRAKCELLRIDAKGNQTYLTKLGRKPELTPLDLEDRSPVAMVKADGGLLIYDENKRHLARYDPEAQVWITVEGDDRKKSGDILTSMQKAFQGKIAQSRTVALPDGKGMLEIKGDAGIWPGGRISLPSLLAITLPGRKNAEVPLHFDFSDDYSEKARFIDTGYMKSNKMLPDRTFTVKQLQEQKRLHPVMVCQTEGHLIIGLRIKPLENASNDEHEAFLPFLWSVPKGNLFDHLGILQTGTKR